MGCGCSVEQPPEPALASISTEASGTFGASYDVVPFHPDIALELSCALTAPDGAANTLHQATSAAGAGHALSSGDAPTPWNPLQPPPAAGSPHQPAFAANARPDSRGPGASAEAEPTSPSALDAIPWSRCQSPAITISEFSPEMHARRVSGRAAMARMHGYTPEIDQFGPPPPTLSAEERRFNRHKCEMWLHETSPRA